MDYKNGCYHLIKLLLAEIVPIKKAGGTEALKHGGTYAEYDLQESPER